MRLSIGCDEIAIGHKNEIKKFLLDQKDVNIESIADFANPMIIGGSYDTLATTIYLQITGAYDKVGAAAMAVVLLSITLLMFAVQKYYLEAKTAATLTGKASRGRMLIEDRSVTVPLKAMCALAATFVILMYICVPIGALFPTWGYKFTPLTFKWFNLVFTRYHGFVAFRDSFLLSLVSAPITALLSMIISYIVVKKRFSTKGFIEAVSMLAMAVPGTVLGVGYILPYRLFTGNLWDCVNSYNCVCCTQPSYRHPKRHLRFKANR